MARRAGGQAPARRAVADPGRTFEITEGSAASKKRDGVAPELLQVVNALPPLKVVQLLGNACLSPTTLAPKDPFRSRGPRWILLFSLFSEEPHWLIPNDLVGALGAMPAAWLATVSRRCHSVDVFQQGRFLFPCQPLTSPLPRSQLHRTKGRLSFKDRSQRSSFV